MASNDYYQQPLSDHSSQPRSHKDRPISQLAYTLYNPNSSSSTLNQSRTSKAYSSRPMSNYYPSHDSNRQSGFSDQIPLKQNARIHTGQENGDWRNERTQYPPSPESNSPHPQLLPDSKGRRKVEGSFGNFFKGKIPWVVYTLSLIQISVFIAEIIKNCKSLFHPRQGPAD
jgi:hypothetical protein